MRGTDDTLKGVIGADVTLGDILDGVGEYSSTNSDSYVFVTDSQLRVLLHPNLPAPENYSDEPISVYIDELERSVMIDGWAKDWDVDVKWCGLCGHEQDGTHSR